MKLIMVRHGESEHNVMEIMQGHIPSRLTLRGIQQAEKARDLLKNEKIDSIFSSDLQRVKQTAEIINEFHNLNINFSLILRERSFGIFEGKLKSELLAAVKKSGLKYHEYRPPQGESCLDIHNKMHVFLEALLKDNPNQTVLIVTHGGNIMELLLSLFPFKREEYQIFLPDNCDITILDIESTKNAKISLLNSKPFDGNYGGSI